MLEKVETIIKEVTGADRISSKEHIQTLWSGYGNIVRYFLSESNFPSVVVKHVSLPTQRNHPRGWNTGLSHQRKLQSYKVEVEWYSKWASLCNKACYVPNCLALEFDGDEIVMVLEDLDASGFSDRKTEVSMKEVKACISWLANFHALFMNKNISGLWTIGTYWHLDTRPDELAVLDDHDLKLFAPNIDSILNNTPYSTIVHGDAKLANFCFAPDGLSVGAVDFQYVGKGCGMKDLAYFIGSCLYEDDCENKEEELLEFYFSALKKAIVHNHIEVDFDHLERNWRELYPVAWTDFHRFIKGWSPGHWKINSYSERLARKVVEKIRNGYEFNR